MTNKSSVVGAEVESTESIVEKSATYFGQTMDRILQPKTKTTKKTITTSTMTTVCPIIESNYGNQF